LEDQGSSPAGHHGKQTQTRALPKILIFRPELSIDVTTQHLIGFKNSKLTDFVVVQKVTFKYFLVISFA
jgi:hypothetical protein